MLLYVFNFVYVQADDKEKTAGSSKKTKTKK